jgi:hypothetical protein
MSGLATVKGANGRTYPLPLLRFLDLIEREDNEAGCWNFVGNRNNKGYGRFRLWGRLVTPHRFAYEAFVGPIPDGLELDHLCRNRSCANPFHCEPVTGQENVQRGWRSRKAVVA